MYLPEFSRALIKNFSGVLIINNMFLVLSKSD
jgi:hypothetical protein